MSIAGAMQSGVSGLLANAVKVGQISGNIANSNTVGYKRTFADMVTTSSGGSSSQTSPAGVRTVVRQEITKQGSMMGTTSATDLAVNGDGMFIVGKSLERSDAMNYTFTRAGSFRPDERGFLVNSGGQYLQGFRFDQQGNLPLVDRTSFRDLTNINISEVATTGEATTRIGLSGNLPVGQTGPAASSAPFQSSLEFYNALGEPDRLVMNWIPSTTSSAWTLHVTDFNGNDYGTVDIQFNDSGPNAGTVNAYSNVVSNATAPAAFTFDPATGTASITVNNGQVPQTIDLFVGQPNTQGGVTQFSGEYSVGIQSRDGAMAGNLQQVEVDNEGVLWGLYDNGTRIPLFEIPLATVNNPDGLAMLDANTYRVSKNSGDMTMLRANSPGAGAILSGNLERSNVDIAKELTDLIETQRAYSSNAKIITTADEMLAETTNIKR